MNRVFTFVVIHFMAAFCVAATAADGIVVPAYQRFRAEQLNSIDAGRLLISELNCQSCHGSFPGQLLAPRKAPVLTKIGERTNAEYLRKYIHDPQVLKPGTAMPGVVSLKSDAAIADSIAAFLTQGTTWRPAGVSAGAVRRGEGLFHTVGCAACHGDQRDISVIQAIRKGISPPSDTEEDEDQPGKPVSNAGFSNPSFTMPLGSLEEKYTVASLATFLQDPHAVRPSGRMPALNLNPKETLDIASYLLRHVKVKANIHFDYYEGEWEKLPDFGQLTPKDSGETTDFSVSVSPRDETFGLRFTGYVQIPADGEYTFFVSSDDGAKLLIDDELVVNNDGLHPGGFKDGRKSLTAGAHAVVLDYFEFHGGEELEVEIKSRHLTRQPLAGMMTLERIPTAASKDEAKIATDELIGKGRRAFAALGCAACHQFGEGDQQIKWTGSAPQFSDMKSTGGCLAAEPVAGVPQFSLSPLQRDDISAAILATREPVSAQQSTDTGDDIRQIMLTMNCYACHARGSIGGVSESMTHVFVGSIPEMGDEGRIPPTLDGAGDKLNEAWLRTILKEGGKDRPYMKTRMPKFGDSAADALVPRFVKSDQQESVAPVEMPEAEHRIKAEARLLVGDKALSCIKCHTFGRYAATGIQSLDMTTMNRRLRRDWFHRYLLDPQKYRPGTRMPAAWPNGRTVVPQILQGDSAVQIEAIWQYLADGGAAKVPSGLLKEAIELVPVERPIIYRNFLEGLSPRGIAVGFPEKVHFAWDAEQMTPRLIWHGGFIDASKHWEGRGPGNQTPLGDHIMRLPSGPPMAVLVSLDEKWPDTPPRDNGFQFKGYTLNTEGAPSFRYQWSDLSVTDFLRPFVASPDNGLQRKLVVKSSGHPENLYLRIAVDQKIDVIDGTVEVHGMRLRIEGVEPIVRQMDDRQELLVPVKPDEAGEATIRYTIVW
ncbi:MAG: PA14 domain-containing protein [Planctomycetaceae bacterium]